MGWNDGPPSWAEMERVLNSRPPAAPPLGPAAVAPSRSGRRASAPARKFDYAELHAHSAYSFLDGAASPEELVAEAARLQLRAIALTDHDGLYGVVRFAEAAAEFGMPTVFGAELSLSNIPRTQDPDPPGPHLLVLARGPDNWVPPTSPGARRVNRAMTSTR